MAQDEFDKRVEAMRREAQQKDKGFSQVGAPERETYFAPWETQGMGPTKKEIGATEAQKETLPAFKSARVSEKPAQPKSPSYLSDRPGITMTLPMTDAIRRFYANAAQQMRARREVEAFKAPLWNDLEEAEREEYHDRALEGFETEMSKYGDAETTEGTEIDGNAWTKHTFEDGSIYFTEDDGDRVLYGGITFPRIDEVKDYPEWEPLEHISETQSDWKEP